MAQIYVVGLFQGKGTAEDACHRLRTEGVPEHLISLLVLHEVAPLPQVISPAVEALSVDPLVLGDARQTFAPYISNGETAVFVAAVSDADIEQAVDTMRQYAPIQIQIIEAAAGQSVSREIL